MCHERLLQGRRDADESRELWRDFESTQPVDDPKAPEAVTEPELAKAGEAIAVSER